MLAVEQHLEQCLFLERSIAAAGSDLPIKMEIFRWIAEMLRSVEGVHHDPAMPVFRHPADIPTDISSSPESSPTIKAPSCSPTTLLLFIT